ncbi:MAG: GNAT family N-acetyltransferase [Candidatus Nanopelagicales bacterium]|nr:GNAT family N-acetyltransferase [Candidatus Nanopelagicales bacterium]MDZ4249284.1 GNAT family N-acetyltransferase [Candidatus Nanopelagicales bacterium]
MPSFPAARGSINASPSDIGRRLTVRYRDGFAKPEREAAGVLDRWTGGLADGILQIRSRDGSELRIRAEDLVAAKVIEPEISAYELQWLAEQAWPPMESQSLNGWELRASQGATWRANSVRVAGRPPKSLADTLRKVERWYAKFDVTPKLQVPAPSGLDSELDELGWTVARTSRMMIASVSHLAATAGAARSRSDLDIEVRDGQNPEWIRLIASYRPEAAQEFDHIMDAPGPAAFVFCRNADGVLLGAGRGLALGDWASITNIDTLSQSRREGIATAILARLAQWAVEQNAKNWFLQVSADNTAARAFYEKHGFVKHHRYQYRSPTQSQPPGE